MKKLLAILLMSAVVLNFCGCGKQVQIFEHKEKLEYKEYKENELKQDVYYVKTGTNFAPVYFPSTVNFKDMAKVIDQKRVVWMIDGKETDFMFPEHYQGELIAYASAKVRLDNIVLERFEDMGYSLGVAGGEIDEDGYYHFSVKKNTVEGSEARRFFGNTESDDIRIVTVGGSKIDTLVDPGSGVIMQLTQGTQYVVEFYSGTYYYRAIFTADTRFFRPFELYKYDKDYLADTTHGYMCFNTPQTLKSGYYMVNGAGMFKYHAYPKGTEVADEDFNEGYYGSLEEAMAAYSQQYNVAVPQTTKNMIITINYGDITDPFDTDIPEKAIVKAPDGTEYEMVVDEQNKKMTLNMEIAQAGDWLVNIVPKSLEVVNVDVKGDDVFEDTTCYEQEFVIEEDRTFQMFYAEVEGDMESDVRGTIIDEEGVTYLLTAGTYEDAAHNKVRYLMSKLPYMKKGTYTVKIYYYKSRNSIKNLTVKQYDDTSSDVFVIGDDGQVYDAE